MGINSVHGRVPVIHYIKQSDEKEFILQKRLEGYIVTKTNSIAEHAMIEIQLVYIGFDLAD